MQLSVNALQGQSDGRPCSLVMKSKLTIGIGLIKDLPNLNTIKSQNRSFHYVELVTLESNLKSWLV